MPTTIESLELEIKSNSTSAEKSIDALSASLSKLKSATKGGAGLTAVTNQLRELNDSAKSLESNSANNIDRLTASLNKLASVGKLKLSSSIANQIRGISEATKLLSGSNLAGIDKLSSSLTGLASVGKATGLSSAFNQLKKLPEITKALSPKVIDDFTARIKALSAALAPLSNQLNTVGNAFSKLPQKVQSIASTTRTLARSNNTASLSYVNLWAKCRMAYVAIRGIGRVLAGWIKSSNDYIENLNLFSVSMGEYAVSAKRYAEQVGEVLGIDPSEFMRNQGIFMTITEGFGVATDRAYLMSKNLTQLGYDLASYYNLTGGIAEAMQKLTSGISGELEPLRRLGYDLSEARLKAIALSLGIEKSYNEMDQAEKAQLRYYAIMTQVTKAQGDMARTLTAPANQLRVLRAQVIMAARALGNIFIPVLNAVLPYAIALAKIIRKIAELIAGLFHIPLPDVSYDLDKTMGGVADKTNDIGKGLDKASKKAKEVKNALLGIDELNIISPMEKAEVDTGKDLGIGGGSGGFGFDLPEYDFLSNAISSKIDEIIQKMKEWLGLTEDIDTWSEFFHTRLGRILTTIGAIGLGLLTWKLSRGLLKGIKALKDLKNAGLDKALTFTVGLSLVVTGVTLETAGIIDAIKHELDGINFAQIFAGSGLVTIGAGFIGKALGSGIIGAAIGAIVGGVPAFITGVYDAFKHGLTTLNGSLIALSSTLIGGGIGALIGGPIGALAGAFAGLKVGVTTDLQIWFYQNLDMIKEGLSKFFTETIPGIWDRFKKWVKGIPGAISDFIDALPEKISNFSHAIWKPIQDFDWNGLGYKIGEWLGKSFSDAINFVKNDVPAYFENLWKKIKTSFSVFFTETLPAFFKETLPSVINKIVEQFKTLPDKIKEKWKAAKEDFVDIGKAIVDGIVEGWKTIKQSIKDFCKGVVDGFKDAFKIHSPSKVFKEIGGFLGEGLLEGIKEPFKSIKKWVKSHIVDPVEKAIKKNPIDDIVLKIKDTSSDWWNKTKTWWKKASSKGIDVKAKVGLEREKWTNVWSWVKGFGMNTLNQNVDLKKFGWSKYNNVLDWVKGFGVGIYNQDIDLQKNNWKKTGNVYSWVKSHGMSNIGQLIDLTKDNWRSAGNVPYWVMSHGMNNVLEGVDLGRSGWSTVHNYVNGYSGGNVGKYVYLGRDGWYTVQSFVNDRSGGGVGKGVSLSRSGWWTVAGWVSDRIGGAVTVAVELYSRWKGRIKDFFGLANGGVITSNGFHLFADGGFVSNGISQFWDAIPKYANGTTNAGLHGSMFVAGENGAEMVGHINGQTEVLNQSQIKLAMRSAVISGMAQFTGYWKAIYSQLAICANAVIRSVMVNTNVIMAQGNNVTYDPSNTLAQSVYEDSRAMYNRNSNEISTDSIRDFYLEYVEPTLKEIASETKRQADKEEQTIVQVGNRIITDAVVTQQKANGFVFTK